MEPEIYTGNLKYRDIVFSFLFDKKELKLIPPKDRKREIEMEWLMTPLGNGAYTMGNKNQ